MKHLISAKTIIPAPSEKVWDYVSDFSDANHQVIAVKETKATGNDNRAVFFKNGHQVQEHLIEKLPNKKLHWEQKNKKGFVPIKNTEAEIILEQNGKNTELSFSFLYDTIMGPIGWIMNLLMIRRKLKAIAESNIRKIQKHFENFYHG